ncbi:MAG: glycosyltransferase family 2 protein [Clostridiales bacterium]|nr:glycosyltransferase family 2 protein [Clostridiales bacterium]
MTNAPIVSVIIPTFNAASYVANAVDSALASREVNVEVIVVDDGSTDDTWLLLDDFDKQVRRMRQNHGGPYRARNLAAREAKGEWLAFLDADDEWLPDKLMKQLARADDSTNLIYTDCMNFGDIDRLTELQSDSVKLFEGDIFEPLLLGNFIPLSSVLIRKSVFEELGGFSVERIGIGDWDFWLRYAASGGLVGLCREPLTRYRCHSGQISRDLDQRAADREAVLRRALLLPKGQQVSRHIARQAFANVWAIGAWRAAAENRSKAIRWYLRAAFYWPWKLQLYKEIIKCCIGRV